MKNLKITKGEWHNNGLEVRAQSGLMLANVYKHLEVNQPKEEAKANAQLIVDAGTTANKCGKLPSELLAERDELLEALKKVDAFIKKNEDVNYWCRLLQREVDTDSIITKTNPKMKTIYLKEANVPWDAYNVFDMNNWTQLEVSDGSINFKSHDNQADFYNSLEIVQQKSSFVSREEFSEFYRMQSEELNQIIKEI